MLIFKASIKQQKTIRNLIEKISAFDPPPVFTSPSNKISGSEVSDMAFSILIQMLPNHIILSQYIQNIPVKSSITNFINFMHQFSTFCGALAIALPTAFGVTGKQLKQAQIGNIFTTSPSPQPTAPQGQNKLSPNKPEDQGQAKPSDKPQGKDLGIRNIFTTGPKPGELPTAATPATSPDEQLGRTDGTSPGGRQDGSQGGDNFLDSWEQLKRFFGTTVPTAMKNSMAAAFSRFLSEDNAQIVAGAITSTITTAVYYAGYGLIAAAPLAFIRIKWLEDLFTKGGIWSRSKLSNLWTSFKKGRLAGQVREAIVKYLFDTQNKKLEEDVGKAIASVKEAFSDSMYKLTVESIGGSGIGSIVQVFSPQRLSEQMQAVRDAYDRASVNIPLDVQVTDESKPQWLQEIREREREINNNLRQGEQAKNRILKELKSMLNNSLNGPLGPVRFNLRFTRQPSELALLIKYVFGSNAPNDITRDVVNGLTEQQVERIVELYVENLKLYTQRHQGRKDLLRELDLYSRILGQYKDALSDIQRETLQKQQFENNPLSALGINLSIKISIPVEPGKVITVDVTDIVKNSNSAQEIVDKIWDSFTANPDINNMISKSSPNDSALFQQSMRSLIAISLYKSLENAASVDKSTATKRDDLIRYVFENDKSLFKESNLANLSNANYTYGEDLDRLVKRDQTLLGEIKDYSSGRKQASNIDRNVLHNLQVIAIIAAMNSNPLYYESISSSLISAYENLTFIRQLGSLVIRTDPGLYSEFLERLLESKIPLTDTKGIVEKVVEVFGANQKYSKAIQGALGNVSNPIVVRNEIIRNLAAMAGSSEALHRYNTAIKNLRSMLSPERVPPYFEAEPEYRDLSTGQRVARGFGKGVGAFLSFASVGVLLDPLVSGVYRLLNSLQPGISENILVQIGTSPIIAFPLYKTVYKFLHSLIGGPPDNFEMSARFVDSISLLKYHNDHFGKLYENLAQRYMAFAREVQDRGGGVDLTRPLKPDNFYLTNIYSDENLKLTQSDIQRIFSIIGKIEVSGAQTGLNPLHGLVLDHLFRDNFNSQDYIRDVIAVLTKEGGLDLNDPKDGKLIRPLVGLVTLRGLLGVFGAAGGANKAAALHVAQILSKDGGSLQERLQRNIALLNTDDIWNKSQDQLVEAIRSQPAAQQVDVRSIPRASAQILKPEHFNLLAKHYRSSLSEAIKDKLRKAPGYNLNLEYQIDSYADQMSVAYLSLLQFSARTVLEGREPSNEDLTLFYRGLNQMNRALTDLAIWFRRNNVNIDRAASILRDIIEVQNSYLIRGLDQKSLKEYAGPGVIPPSDLEKMITASRATGEWLEHLRSNKENLSPGLRDLPTLKIILQPEEVIGATRAQVMQQNVPQKPTEFRPFPHHLDPLAEEWRRFHRNWHELHRAPRIRK
jgi:hypothetical protein